MPVVPALARRLDTLARARTSWTPAFSVAQLSGLLLVLLLSSVRLISGTHNPFIYFRF
jgi:hypothetical protein